MHFRLRDYILSPLAIWRHHQFLSESQFWPIKKRQDWIKEKLDYTLKNAVRNVPYYKRTLSPYISQFNDMIDRLDLSELPILTKDIIRQHYHELKAENSHKLRIREDKTSGSTGTPMKFLLDKKSDIHQFASIWRVLNWTGYKFGNRYASIDTTFEKETTKLNLYNFKQNCLNIPFVNLNKNNIKQCVDSLKKFNPVVIKTYPSALALISHWLQEFNINDFRPKAVLACAETLLDTQKQIISEVLKCPIFDFYGQNERACLISTCEKGAYHIHEEYSFVELIQENTADTECLAHIIATTFDNSAMPLIRYKTNDMAVLNHNNAFCECGKTYKIIERVIGRIEDVILTPEGRHVTRMDVPFKYCPSVLEAQIIQRQVDKIELILIKSENFKPSELDTLLHHLRLRLGNEMTIEYNFVKEIPLGQNGKKKFIVSEIAKNKNTIKIRTTKENQLSESII